MQSTDLTDKNGKEIFEEDILVGKNRSPMQMFWVPEDGMWSIPGAYLISALSADQAPPVTASVLRWRS